MKQLKVFNNPDYVLNLDAIDRKTWFIHQSLSENMDILFAIYIPTGNAWKYQRTLNSNGVYQYQLIMPGDIPIDYGEGEDGMSWMCENFVF